MTFSFYCEQWNNKLSEQYLLHLYFSIVVPWRLISCWQFLVVLRNFFLFILIFLAMSVLFINLTAFINFIFTFLLCQFQINCSNSCHVPFEDPLFIYFCLPRSQWCIQMWYISVLGWVAPFSFLWGGIKELLMCQYSKGLQGKAGNVVPCLSQRCHRVELLEHGGGCTAGSAGGKQWPHWILCLTAPSCSQLSEVLIAWALSLSIKWRWNISILIQGKVTDLQSGPLFYILPL